MMFKAVIAPVIVCAFATPSYASLWGTAYNMGQTPSAQGWQYFSLNSGLTESNVFSSTNGILTSNTIGNGYQGQGGNLALGAATAGSFDANQDWKVEARVRVLQGELWSFHYGFCIGAEFDGMSASLGIMPGTWQDTSLGGGARDNTQWTTWRLQTDRQAGVFRVYADDQLMAVRALTFASASPGFPRNYTFLGDGTGGANAHAEISSFSFTQIAIPAPGALALLAVAGIMRNRRRR
jgi:hypothetical protein